MTDIDPSTTVEELIQRFRKAREECNLVVKEIFHIPSVTDMPFGIVVSVGFDEKEMDDYWDEYSEEEDE